jgi:hypothetical protein
MIISKSSKHCHVFYVVSIPLCGPHLLLWPEDSNGLMGVYGWVGGLDGMSTMPESGLNCSVL